MKKKKLDKKENYDVTVTVFNRGTEEILRVFKNAEAVVDVIGAEDAFVQTLIITKKGNDFEIYEYNYGDVIIERVTSTNKEDLRKTIKNGGIFRGPLVPKEKRESVKDVFKRNLHKNGCNPFFVLKYPH